MKLKKKFRLTLLDEASPELLPEVAVSIIAKGEGDGSNRHIAVVIGGVEVFHLYEDGDYIVEESTLDDLGFKLFVG